jgi:hypothetical protein
MILRAGVWCWSSGRDFFWWGEAPEWSGGFSEEIDVNGVDASLDLKPAEPRVYHVPPH